MAETLARLFRRTVAYDKPDAMLTRREGRYEPIPSREMERLAGRLHLALKRRGIQAGDRVALLSENRWEWAVSDFALMTAGAVSVPVYATLPADQIRYVLEHSEARLALVSTAEQLAKIQELWAGLSALEGVIIFDPVESDDSRVVRLAELVGEDDLTEDERRELEAAVDAVRPEDVASVIYTSGTTGLPKGVVLTHGNFSTNVRDCGITITPEDSTLSFLPLSHVAQRIADYAFFSNGASVAYPESLDTVARDMAEVRPTIVLGVPRFFEKIHARVQTATDQAPAPRRKLMRWAVEVGRQSSPYRLRGERLPLGLRMRFGLAERLVFRRLRERLGGRIKFFVSGAAPLPRHLAEFFYAVGIPICEAYGLTETSPIVSINRPDDLKFGAVGRTIAHVEVRIAGDGEILVRGPNVMQGYFKDPEATAKAIVDGWFHTGDIGSVDEDGFLRVTDRKKDLFKTSGGKFVAPQPIENQIKTSRYVAAAVLVADQRRFPLALVAPEFDELERFAREEGVEAASRAELAKHERIQRLLEEEVRQACAKLARHEQPKRVLIIDHELTIRNGELTPTQKVRRRAVEERYAREIERVYEEAGRYDATAVAGSGV